MASVFIFHGVYGDSHENWFPWLKTELEKKGHKVFVPDFPHADRPQLKEWLEHLAQYERNIDEQTVFVGHSLGVAFALRYLEHSQKKIASSFFVAPVWEIMDNEFDSLMLTFTAAPYDWKAAKEHCANFTILQSTNDPYIMPDKTSALAKHLDVSVTVIQNAGHFNAPAGYTKFPQLRDMILESIRD